MMLRLPLFLLLLACLSDILAQDYIGPIPQPPLSYGSAGNRPIADTSLNNPAYPLRKLRVYYPGDLSAPAPTVFFAHGFGAEDPVVYRKLLEFLASKGYAVVYVPYPSLLVSHADRYKAMSEGFKTAAAKLPGIIDTSRAGFAGHSYGGGAVFSLAYQAFVDWNWGLRGRFMFSMAPWYAHEITPEQLAAYPANTRLIVQIYQDDVVNDHRMAVDLFQNCNIADGEKDFYSIQALSVAEYPYLADHSVPSTVLFDAYDAYWVFRPLEALADYAFRGSPIGRAVALGNGNLLQTLFPGGDSPAVSITDDPEATRSQGSFLWPCDNAINPRREYCERAITALGSIPDAAAVTVAPNPAVDYIEIRFPNGEDFSFQLLDISGRRQNIAVELHTGTARMNLLPLPSGLYLLQYRSASGRQGVIKVVKGS